ncbi:MAG: putative membrane protein [Marivirga sp.]|jgi:putative membrane protein
MIITKNLSFKRIMQFSGHHIIWLTTWMTAVTLLYHYTKLQWLTIPWLPLSLIGTAVAFYVGFKNNSAYDRMWEARKIWGGIVNSSRSWGMYVKSFVSNQFTDEATPSHKLQAHKKRLIYRHIAWLYVLRNQLLQLTTWEHANQRGLVGKAGRKYIRNFGTGLMGDEINSIQIKDFLPLYEYDRLMKSKNTATQIIDQQATDLASLRAENLIDDFRHMEMQKILSHFYEHQGKTERIKKFPLPRQYGSMSFVFVGIFIFLLPFGMVSEFAKLGDFGIWLSIPFAVLVGWVFIVMEIIGDYTENPFQGMANDIPMLSLCRTIEIDLREMLGETKLPAAIQSKNGIMM